MRHDATEFVPKIDLQVAGIVGNAFGADKHIAVHHTVGVGKGNNVGVIVVVEVFDVYPAQVFIGAEDPFATAAARRIVRG